MAIARGAGTEIIRSAAFFDLSAATNTKLIFGVQHHIYTILNISIYCISNVSPFTVEGHLVGWDSDNGTSARDIILFKNSIQAGQTYVWDNKISFNGAEPTGLSGTLNGAAYQDAIADQGTATAQYFYIETGSASDSLNAFVTYIDQNNA